MASPAVRCTSRETGGGSCAAPWSWAAEFCSSIAMAASTGGSPYTDANPNASSPPSRPARRPHTSRERMDIAQWQGKPRRCRPSCTSSCTFMPLKIAREPCSVLTKYITSRNRSPANTAHGRICRTGIAGTLRGRGALTACDMSPPRVRATRYWSGTTVEGLTHAPGGHIQRRDRAGISPASSYHQGPWERTTRGSLMTSRVVLICHAATSATRRAAFPFDEPIESAPPAIPMRADVFLTAPETSCQQTAKALGLPATIDTTLRDCEYGMWRGRTLDELTAAEPDA